MLTVRDGASGQEDFLRLHDSVVIAAQRLRAARVSSLPVVDDAHELCGQLSTSDIVTGCVAAGRDPLRTQVCECATGPDVTVEADEPLIVVLEMMADRRVDRVLALDGNRFVGWVTYRTAYDLALTAVDGDPRLVGRASG